MIDLELLKGLAEPERPNLQGRGKALNHGSITTW